MDNNELIFQNIDFSDEPKWFYHRFKEVYVTALNRYDYNNKYITSITSTKQFIYSYDVKTNLIYEDPRYIFGVKCALHLKRLFKTNFDAEINITFIVPSKNAHRFINLVKLITNESLDYDVYLDEYEFSIYKEKYIDRNVLLISIENIPKTSLLELTNNLFPLISFGLA